MITMKVSLSISRVFFAFSVTVAFGIWLHIIGRQYLPAMLLSVNLISFGLIAYVAWPCLRKRALILRLLAGACIGYLASVVSAAVVTLALYDSSQFIERFFPSSLYVYPFISLGWLYGVVIVALVGHCGSDKAQGTPGLK